MTGEVSVLGLVTIILGSGVLGAVSNWALNRHRPKIDKHQALLSTEQIRSEIHTADIEGLRSIITSLVEHQTWADNEIREMRARLEVAERRADKAERRAEALAEDAAYVALLLERWPPPSRPPARPRRTGRASPGPPPTGGVVQ